MIAKDQNLSFVSAASESIPFLPIPAAHLPCLHSPLLCSHNHFQIGDSCNKKRQQIKRKGNSISFQFRFCNAHFIFIPTWLSSSHHHHQPSRPSSSSSFSAGCQNTMLLLPPVSHSHSIPHSAYNSIIISSTLLHQTITNFIRFVQRTLRPSITINTMHFSISPAFIIQTL